MTVTIQNPHLANACLISAANINKYPFTVGMHFLISNCQSQYSFTVGMTEKHVQLLVNLLVELPTVTHVVQYPNCWYLLVGVGNCW